MKKTIVFFLITFFCLQSNAQYENLYLINSYNVTPDVQLNGVRGINISYKVSFFSLIEMGHNDTILKNSVFELKHIINIDGMPVKPANGYEKYTNEKGDLIYKSMIYESDMHSKFNEAEGTFFIPYAALNVNKGPHKLSISGFLSGKCGDGKTYQETKKIDNISVEKPAVKTVSVNIDYIEAKLTNERNNAWDVAFFKTNAPDVGVRILIGGIEVWSEYVNDNYMFSIGPKSRDISFSISENDRIAFKIEDIDVMYHDLIALWSFETKGKTNGNWYVYDKAKGNINSCFLKFKID